MMGDERTDEAVQEIMIQTDADHYKSYEKTEKPKPPLPKKPPVAVKPKVIANENKGKARTSKILLHLPKTFLKDTCDTEVKNALPLLDSGGNAVNNKLPAKSSVSDLSCDLKQHISESSGPEVETKQSSLALSQTNLESDTLVSSQSNGEKEISAEELVDSKRSRSLEWICNEHGDTISATSGQFDTLLRTPPKISPKPSKKPPNVLPKPKISESEMNFSTSLLKSTCDKNKDLLNNNFLHSCNNPEVHEKLVSTCSEPKAQSDVETNKLFLELSPFLKNDSSKLPLDSKNDDNCQCSASSIGTTHALCGTELLKVVNSKLENTCGYKTVNCQNNMNSFKIDSEEHSIGACIDSFTSVCNKNLDQDLDHNITFPILSPQHKKTLPNNDQSFNNKENIDTIKKDSAILISERNNLINEKADSITAAFRLSVPSPAPRRLSPKPKPIPRKRLSLSKGCDKNSDVELYLDCYSAKYKSASSENLHSINKEMDDLNENFLKIKSDSFCTTQSLDMKHVVNDSVIDSSEKNISFENNINVKSPSIENVSNENAVLDLKEIKTSFENDVNEKSPFVNCESLSNISKINISMTREREKHDISYQRISSDNDFLESNFQKHIDFSPMTEEALGETSSLLDEIEQIVSRRISALGGRDSIYRKSHSIETSTPVRPPRSKKKKSQKIDHETSDIYSISSDVLFKGSETSLNLIDDEDQPFKGSNSSLASNQSETHKQCPPKPPRKKLLSLNRSQSDVSASKYINKKKDIAKQNQIHDACSDEKSPKISQRKGRSLTVDFHVPANQESLLKEIELANQRNLELSQSNSSAQKVKPRRKAPPPPVPKVKITDSGLNQEPQHHDLNDDKKRTSSVEDQDYVEIPEEFLENHSQNNDENSFQRCKKSPSAPELPPRNHGAPITSPQLSIKSSTTKKTVICRDRPVSDVSQNSSLSSQESPLQDESSSESDDENLEDRATKKKAKKIYCIVKEIASSEHVFVDILKLLNVDFRLHISRATEIAGRPVIPSEVLNRILNYLPQLQHFNEDLLHDLEERVANWGKCKKVADIFVRKGPFLKMYTSYITDFEETNKIFDDAIKKMPAFQQCVKEFEMTPRCASLGIKHYLLKPIQRIPQYKLLLQDYQKNMSPNSEDYNNTRDALAIVSEVADHANDSMRQGDQVQKMLEIQKSLDGHFEVIKPGRVLIKKGELMKCSRKEMQPRMFFLFNDVLLYTTPTPTGGYRLNNVLTLVGMRVTLPASEEYNTEFNIVSLQRSFAVEASSVDEKDEWVKALVEAIEDNTLKRNTFESVKVVNQSINDKDFVLGSKAPIWIPDARVTMCMLCTCQFSVAWRRHHCRSCGRVICSSCSDHKAPLEYLRNKLARVCNECYQKLVTDFEDRVNTGTVTEAMTEDTDGSFLSLSSLKERFQQIRRSGRFTTKTNKQKPQRLVAVRANDLYCRISGNLRVLDGKKWRKYWFLLKDKVLYKYKASEDIAAIDTLAVIGYDVIRFTENFEGIAAHLLFKLSHINQAPIIFQTDNQSLTERWFKAMEEAVKG